MTVRCTDLDDTAPLRRLLCLLLVRRWLAQPPLPRPCWRCDTPRPETADPCPHCAADPVPF
jgi:hypothetical protein